MDENLPNKIDQLFNNALQKFKSDPSDEVWNKIEEGLDEQDREIAVLSLGWKRYAAAAVLLIVAFGISTNIYFRQRAIAKVKFISGLKAPGPLVIFPKTNLPDNDRDVKAGAAFSGKEKSTSILPILAENDKKQVVIREFHNKALANLTAQQNHADRGEGGSVSDKASLHMVSTQAVESRLLPKPSITSELPINEIKDKRLIVIHPKTQLKNRLSITPYFSQEFAGYSLTDNDLTGANRQEIEERERNVFSASVGFFINYRLSKRWVLQTGVSYSWSNSDIDSATSYAVKDNHGNIQYKLNTISGYGYLHDASLARPSLGDSVTTGKSRSQLHYLTIPLILSYQVPLGRFSLLIGAGGTFNVLTGAEIETKTYGTGDPEKEFSVNMMGLKKVNYGMILKLDLEYDINSRIGVDLMPCFKNTLSPINLEGAVTAYPYNFGIGAGVTYRF